MYSTSIAYQCPSAFISLILIYYLLPGTDPMMWYYAIRLVAVSRFIMDIIRDFGQVSGLGQKKHLKSHSDSDFNIQMLLEWMQCD